ncbi:MAG: thioredoxin-like domain-containing protein [Bacteroidota bacterium]
MKRVLLLMILAISVSCTNAQKTNTGAKAKTDSGNKQSADADIPPPPPTVKAKPIPAYRILNADSAWVTPANLAKGKPVVIIYFSPDCSHCQRMMYELKPKLKELQNIEVVMITWSMNYDIRGIKEFRRDYGLKDYHNFTLGTEGYTKKVQDYYEVKTTPFIALYNSNGSWSKYFDKVPKTEDVLAGIKKLK